MDILQLSRACEFLEHYHLQHTQDRITRVRRHDIHIYIVSDEEWRKKIDDLIRPIMEVQNERTDSH